VWYGDDGAAVEGRVNGAQTENLGFCPTGSGAEECRAGMAQVGIAMVPELTRVCVAGKGRLLREEVNLILAVLHKGFSVGAFYGRLLSSGYRVEAICLR
jgi:hypothetical protein